MLNTFKMISLVMGCLYIFAIDANAQSLRETKQWISEKIEKYQSTNSKTSLGYLNTDGSHFTVHEEFYISDCEIKLTSTTSACTHNPRKEYGCGHTNYKTVETHIIPVHNIVSIDVGTSVIVFRTTYSERETSWSRQRRPGLNVLTEKKVIHCVPGNDPSICHTNRQEEGFTYRGRAHIFVHEDIKFEQDLAVRLMTAVRHLRTLIPRKRCGPKQSGETF